MRVIFENQKQPYTSILIISHCFFIVSYGRSDTVLQSIPTEKNVQKLRKTGLIKQNLPGVD